MDKEKWERACRKMGMTPVERVESKDGVILVAEGYCSPTDEPREEYPMGFYKTAWAVDADGVMIGKQLEFEAFHDTAMTQEDKKQGRINATIQDARGYLGLMFEIAGNA